jgi:hypothetical protein
MVNYFVDADNGDDLDDGTTMDDGPGTGVQVHGLQSYTP